MSRPGELERSGSGRKIFDTGKIYQPPSINSLNHYGATDPVKGDSTGRHYSKLQQSSKSEVTIIPFGVGGNPGGRADVPKKGAMSREKDVLRPDLAFVSNARPASLRWRELEVEKMNIITTPEKKHVGRKHKKYIGRASDYQARKFTKESLRPKSLLKKKKTRTATNNINSSTSWLSSPKFLNGVPRTIYHFRYPLKTSRLQKV